MRYFVYKTTNLINGKIYIGAHKTNNVNDNYIGSGKLLKLAIKKYGVDNFEREILEEFESSKDMYDAEKRYVNEECVNSQNTYNLKAGGEGGFDYINANKLFATEDVLLRRKEGLKKAHLRGDFIEAHKKAGITKRGKKWTIEQKLKLSNYFKEHPVHNKLPEDVWLQRKHLIETSSVDLMKFGWVAKVIKSTGLTKRIIEDTVLHCKMSVFKKRIHT